MAIFILWIIRHRFSPYDKFKSSLISLTFIHPKVDAGTKKIMINDEQTHGVKRKKKFKGHGDLKHQKAFYK